MNDGAPLINIYVYSPSVSQVDLMAMKYGYCMAASPWIEEPEDWTEVRLTKMAQ